jgi:hypothetical protein
MVGAAVLSVSAGYRDRSLMLAAEYARRIQTGGGLVRPLVLIGGRVAGTWRLTRRTAGAGQAARATLTVEPFTALPAASADGLAAEAADIGRFLGADVTLKKVET